jgi:hypothetical protein
MASKKYKQMIQRGKWLEEFLNPDLKPWRYKQLALQFIDIYQVEFKLSRKDLSIQFLEMLAENPQIERVKLFHNFDSISTTQINHINNLFKVKKIIETAFKIIQSNSKPWGYHFSETKLREKHNQKDFNYLKLVSVYDGLVNHLYMDEDGLIKKNVFYVREFHECYPDESEKRPSTFPWVVAASRMFFDFLFMGGQEYFLFCKQCGRFSVIERKGRKKFCSDICKTRFRTTNIS